MDSKMKLALIGVAALPVINGLAEGRYLRRAATGAVPSVASG
jgi:hypothetical protein